MPTNDRQQRLMKMALCNHAEAERWITLVDSGASGTVPYSLRRALRGMCADDQTGDAIADQLANGGGTVGDAARRAMRKAFGGKVEDANAVADLMDAY